MFNLNKFLWENPIKNFFYTIYHFGTRGQFDEMLYFGNIVYSTELPWHYLISWIVISNPTHIIFLSIFVLLGPILGIIVSDVKILSFITTSDQLNTLDAITRGSIIYGNSSAATARLAAGGAGTVLTSDGTDIAWGASSGITSVVADTSPQLGGTLDGNGQDINITTNKKVQFRDAALFINSSTDGQLDIAADALTKVSGNVTLGTNASNTITLTGTLDCGTL